MRQYQAFNGRIGAWVVINQYADGHCVIVDVKQRNPRVPFSGVPKK